VHARAQDRYLPGQLLDLCNPENLRGERHAGVCEQQESGQR
jgi:hypothetical protein